MQPFAPKICQVRLQTYTWSTSNLIQIRTLPADLWPETWTLLKCATQCFQYSAKLLRRVIKKNKSTRHRASTSMYSLTFCIRLLLPERHQRKPTVQAAAVMLRTPSLPPSMANHWRASDAHFPYTAHSFENASPSPASQRPAARADPAQPAVCTMSSYRRMDASL